MNRKNTGDLSNGNWDKHYTMMGFTAIFLKDKSMKQLLLTPFLLALIFGCSNQKEPTYKQIVSQCKGAGSKYAEYNEIGMTQFAKNYLDLCIKTEAKKVLQGKYIKCLKKNNAAYCQSTIKLD